MGIRYRLLSFVIFYTPSEDIIDTFESPNGKYVAVVSEISGNATVGFGKKVFICRKGFQSKTLKYPSLVMIKCEDVSFFWINDDIFRIKYKKAKISNFSNVWYDLNSEPLHRIELQIEPIEFSALEPMDVD